MEKDDEEEGVYVIHPRRVLNNMFLEKLILALKEADYSVYQDVVGRNLALVAVKNKPRYLWVQVDTDLPEIGDMVEIIDVNGYQLKAEYVVDKYGNKFFQVGEEIETVENVVVWRKL